MSKKEGIDAIKAKKLAAIKSAIRNIEKSLKQEGVVQILGEGTEIKIDKFPSGSLLFDIALGGGVPKGRIIELYGAESSGKTLCASKMAAEVQRAGGYVAFVDMEHAYDTAFSRKLGVNTDELILSQPTTMEEAFEIIDQLIDTGAVDLIILDSIASLVPRDELEGAVDKQSIGLVARGMSKFLRRVTGKLSQTKTTLVCINQVRDAIGVMYGDPTTTPGGKALKFYASVRVQVSKVGGSNETKKIGGEELVIGHKIRVNVKKNKVAPPFRKAEFAIYYDGRPTDKIAELAEAAVLKGIIPKYDAKGNRSATGRTYLWPNEPQFRATSRGDVPEELKKFPDMQAELINILTNGLEVEPEPVDEDENMTEDEFENTLLDAEDDGAEESSWEDM